MKHATEFAQQIPLDIVGSSTYGKNPKIMASRTFNMMFSDDWLVNYAGYQKKIQIDDVGEGRGIFSSVVSNSLFAVINENVYRITEFSVSQEGIKTFSTRLIGIIGTVSGDVFIDENNVNQVAFCDQVNLYIYNYLLDTFQVATLPADVVPGYVSYQNGRFRIPDTSTNRWYLSDAGNGLNWFWGPSGEPVFSAIQTKPDLAQAVLRFPGRSDLALVIGKTVSELWSDIGAPTFPYQKVTSLNFDYGCISSATIATSEDFIAWLGTNERSEAVIMFSNGSDIKTISTDGINNKLQALVAPEKSVGFFVKIYGHLIYHLTFYDPRDNYSLIYDFTVGKFFDVTDEDMNYFIARRVAYFDDGYYFISLNDGHIYFMSSDITSYDYGFYDNGDAKVFEIPRVRVCSNFRLPNSGRFIVSNVSFTMEQGNDPENTINNPNYVPKIGMSISIDGGITYSSYSTKDLNLYANRQNIVSWYKLGSANDFVAQFRLWGKGPWNAFNGVMEYYQ